VILLDYYVDIHVIDCLRSE